MQRFPTIRHRNNYKTLFLAYYDLKRDRRNSSESNGSGSFRIPRPSLNYNKDPSSPSSDVYNISGAGIKTAEEFEMEKEWRRIQEEEEESKRLLKEDRRWKW